MPESPMRARNCTFRDTDTTDFPAETGGGHPRMNPYDATVLLTALGYDVSGGYVLRGKHRYGRITEGAFVPEGAGAVPVPWKDRWDTDREFYQGGCFLYFEGETLGDFCDKNGEPRPVCDVPEELYDAFEENDIESIIKIGREIPEMKEIVKGLRNSRNLPAATSHIVFYLQIPIPPSQKHREGPFSTEQDLSDG